MVERHWPARTPNDEHPPERESDFARILAYVSGEGTAEERRALETWIAAAPARRALVDELRLYRALRPGTFAWDTERALRRALDGLGREDHVPPPDRRPSPPTPKLEWRRQRAARFSPVLVGRPRRSVAPWLVAAALVMAVGVALARHAEQRSAAPRLRSVIATDTVAPHVFATARAQRAEIRLSDGTTVLLAPASRLRVPRDYGNESRDVGLDGEAYFVVQHDPAFPFRVHTAHSVTEDLGTKFSVRAYTTDTTVRVVVVEGKVALRPARESRVSAADTAPQAAGTDLTARQIAVLLPSGTLKVRTVATVAADIAWTDGRLVFHDVPLRDVLAELNRWYALDLRLAEPALGERRLTSSFGDESVSEILHSLEVTLDLHAQREGDIVRLSAALRDR